MIADSVAGLTYLCAWVAYLYPLVIIVAAMIVYLTIANMFASAKKGI